jgi:dihydroneopterin aldolase
MTVTIEVLGLELFGRHGALEQERRDGQRFLFDLWLDVPAAAVASDRLEDAVDYRELVALVRDVSDGRTFRLLEALAGELADAVLRRFPVERVRVRVRKPDVRLPEPVEHTAVSVERERPSA